MRPPLSLIFVRVMPAPRGLNDPARRRAKTLCCRPTLAARATRRRPVGVSRTGAAGNPPITRRGANLIQSP
jgi:hypothetical protein